jgi:hypothetical protein
MFDNNFLTLLHSERRCFLREFFFRRSFRQVSTVLFGAKASSSLFILFNVLGSRHNRRMTFFGFHSAGHSDAGAE